jgi:hypothetical protein
MKRLASLLGATAALAGTAHARADVSSWAYVGSGLSSLKQQNLELRVDPTLAIETGIGTAPKHPLIVGGLFKLQALFGDGADLGVSLRVATRSFVTGNFGLALDAGPYQRFWGEGSSGGQASLVLGAPWGITLSLGAGIGTNEARQYGATLGLDFARLTVYRLAGEDWFPNPRPAYRPKE